MSDLKKEVCWNPFGTCTSSDNQLRKISKNNKKKFESVPENAVVCLKCRLAIGKMDSIESEDANDCFEPASPHGSKVKLNTALVSLDETEIDDKR